VPFHVHAQNAPSLEAFTGWLNVKNQLRLAGFLIFVSLIPFAVIMTTSFTRIAIVFQFLRQALGLPQVPSNQIIVALSLILTGFVMQPVFKQAQAQALTPYFNGELKTDPEVASGEKSEEEVLIERGWKPLQTFLLAHAREQDLALFLDLAQVNQVQGEDIPWYVLVPAFMLSELRTAFMMGFLLFLPFLIIDMVVTAVLMSMGMMMLPPVLISAPFKVLLFILVDGWRLIVQQLIIGYRS
jgi:flagellar biosynthetic protein FliP